MGVLLSEWNNSLVREERELDASGVSVVMWQAEQLRIVSISAESI